MVLLDDVVSIVDSGRKGKYLSGVRWARAAVGWWGYEGGQAFDSKGTRMSVNGTDGTDRIDEGQ